VKPVIPLGLEVEVSAAVADDFNSFAEMGVDQIRWHACLAAGQQFVPARFALRRKSFPADKDLREQIGGSVGNSVIGMSPK
jgi:hypothetical protein